MNSRLTATEQVLATLACDKIRTRPGARILIGGLGMGFTLRAALIVLAGDAAITVAELVPEVVAWARGPMAGLFGTSLTDPRVHIHQGDVGELIGAAEGAYDAILLDVDNGPNGITRAANDRLYDRAGLAAAHRALRPGGVLAVWSSTRDDKFTARLRKAGFIVVENPVRAKGPQGGAQHFIWTATRA
jgi:spermidine synthase